MQPLCTALDHSLAFGGELPEIRGEDRRGDDSLGHGCGGEDVKVAGQVVVGAKKRGCWLPVSARVGV